MDRHGRASPGGGTYLVRMAGKREDWAAALERLADGDRRALLRLTRLVNGFLRRWNAYDFRDDWEDLVQEVLMAGVRAQREGRIRERGHVYGFLKTVARNKFVDELKRRLRAPARERLAWEDEVDEGFEPAAPPRDPGLARDVQRAMAGLEERRRRAVVAVYVEGKTHQEAMQSTGIPVGSLRRYLREGLAELRAALERGGGAATPGPAAADGGEGAP